MEEQVRPDSEKTVSVKGAGQDSVSVSTGMSYSTVRATSSTVTND